MNKLMLLLTVLLGSNANEALQAQNTIIGKRILIAYYSRSGNTETVARLIQKNTGGELFRIETAAPYPEDYDQMVKKASEEKKSGYKPPLKSKVAAIDSYDILYVGFPIWDMSLPAPIKSFLSDYDLSTKTIIPFCTNDGYGKGSSFDTVKELSPKSKFLDGFVTEGKNAGTSESQIKKWLYNIGMLP
jgi:flavodoxin